MADRYIFFQCGHVGSNNVGYDFIYEVSDKNEYTARNSRYVIVKIGMLFPGK